MLRNLSRTLLIAGAAWLSAASALSAQAGTAPVRGDVDGDGQITVTDARIVSDYLVGRQVPAGANVAQRGDVNGDGRVTSVDAAIIRASAAGRDVSRFKVGAPVGEVPASALAELVCNADVHAKTVRCSSTGETSTGARGIIIGNQNVNVKLTSSNVQVSAGHFTFDVTVQNLLPQRLGTDSLGASGPADSVRVFFLERPTPNGAGDSGEIDVLQPGSNDPAGNGTFTAGGQYYYAYAAPLDSGEVSGPVNWHFFIPATVSNFQFKVYVDAGVQFPDGWVSLSPPALRASGPYYASTNQATAPVDTVSRDPEAPNYRAPFKLGAVVRTRLGTIPDDTTVTWETSASAVATVTDAGIDSATVAFVGDGDVTLTAHNTSHEKNDTHQRAGQVQYVVRSADSTTSTISAVPGVQTVGDSSQVVVQLKNSAGVNLTQSGGTVALSATGGTLSAVSNNHDGTYTAWLKSTTTGSYTVSGTLNNHTLVDTAVVTFGPRPADHFVVEAAGGGAIGAQVVNTPFNIQITAKDVFGNTATGFTGSATITSTPTGHVSAGGTTAAFTAGVLASHAVTIDDIGDFTLTATNGSVAGTSNSFQVQQAPTAVNDAPAANSTPGSAFHGAFNTAFNLAAPGIMANDTRGYPLATVTSFGADSLGGTITDHAAGETVNLTGGGTLQVNADGSVVFNPRTGFTGLYVFHYRISNVRGTSDAQVTIAIGTRPAAVDDSYGTNLLGNVPINTATSTQFKVTTNDAGDAKVLALGTASHGTAVLNQDGTFTFAPDAGYTGAASFTYTVKNGFGTTAAATVSLNVSGIAWFVNTTADGGNDGRYGSAFDNLNTAFAAAVKPAANQPIFVYSGSYTGGVTLLSGQSLVGQGVSGDFATAMGVTWPADAGPLPTVGGTRPTISSGLSLTNGSSGNTLRGFDLTGSATALAGTSFGTLTVGEVGINVSGQALSLNTGTLAGTGFTQLRSSGGTNNVSLTSVATSGTPALGTNADALSGATGSAFVISGGNGTFTYAGPVSNSAAGQLAVSISGKTGGSVTFSGDINPAGAANGISVANNNSGTNTITFSGANKKISSGSAAGVNLSNNAGATISFTNGGLAISTTSGNGFSATGGGEVGVTGSNNTIGSAGGIALNVSSTTIGSSGLTFRSISASGGSNGIFLSSTGTLAGLTVTGDGSTNGSGGTIANTTGGDGASAGNGVYLSSAQKVSLSWMSLSGHQNHALYGTSAKDVDLNHVRITGNNGTSNSGTFQEGAVHLVNATGGITVKNSRLDGSAYTAFLVEQLSGAPAADSIVAAFDTISTGQGSTVDVRGTGLQTIVTSGSANVRYRNNSVTYWWNTGIQVAVQNTAGASTALIQNNKVNQTSGALNAAGGIEVNGGPLAFNISGNNITGADGTAISADKNQGNTFFNGTIDNNTIGTAGVTNSGSATGTGIFVQHAGPNATTVKITNNIIRQINGSQAIWTLLGDDSGGGGVGTLNATITGNNIAQEGSAATVRTGIVIQSGRVTGDTDLACYDVSSNSITNFNTRIRPNQRFNTVMRLPGYTGSSGDATAVNTYMQNRNAGTTAVTSTSTAGGGGIFNTSPAGSACPQPTL